MLVLCLALSEHPVAWKVTGQGSGGGETPCRGSSRWDWVLSGGDRAGQRRTRAQVGGVWGQALVLGGRGVVLWGRGRLHIYVHITVCRLHSVRLLPFLMTHEVQVPYQQSVMWQFGGASLKACSLNESGTWREEQQQEAEAQTASGNVPGRGEGLLRVAMC